jgi:hypothetical protein
VALSSKLEHQTINQMNENKYHRKRLAFDSLCCRTIYYFLSCLPKFGLSIQQKCQSLRHKGHKQHILLAGRNGVSYNLRLPGLIATVVAVPSK